MYSNLSRIPIVAHRSVAKWYSITLVLIGKDKPEFNSHGKMCGIWKPASLARALSWSVFEKSICKWWNRLLEWWGNTPSCPVLGILHEWVFSAEQRVNGTDTAWSKYYVCHVQIHRFGKYKLPLFPCIFPITFKENALQHALLSVEHARQGAFNFKSCSLEHWESMWALRLSAQCFFVCMEERHRHLH